MFICWKCKAFKEQLPTFEDDRGEFWGSPCTQTETDFDCGCGGEYVEAAECPLCGMWEAEEDMLAVCDDCLKLIITVNNALDYIKDNELETEFFVETWLYSEVKHASTELVDLCSQNWEETYKSEFTKRDAESRLLVDYIGDNKHDFAEWYVGKKEKENV